MNISKSQRVVLWVAIIFLIILGLNAMGRTCGTWWDRDSSCDSEKIWQSIIIGGFIFGLLFLVFSKGKQNDS